MADTQTAVAPTPDQLLADFEKLLEPDPRAPIAEAAEPVEAVAEPEPEPEPETPRVAASTGEPDKRTREGKRRSIQAEIDAETARKYAAKTEADAEEARLTTLRAEAARLARAPRSEPAPVAQPAAAPEPAYKRFLAMPDAPKPDQFTGDNAWNEYQFAVGLFIADKRLQEQQYSQQVSQQTARLQTRVQSEITKDPSFQQRFSETPVDTRMIPYLHQHPQGEDIMVYLVNNPPVAQRLATLNFDQNRGVSTQQIEAIGKIVGILESRSTAAPSGPASKPVAISQAKPLIKPVSAAPNASDDDDEPDESELPVEEFIRRNNKRESRAMPRRARY